MRIDYRWSTGDAANTRKYAAELVALAPDGILTNGAAAVAPLLQVTRTVPPTKCSVAELPPAIAASAIQAMSR